MKRYFILILPILLYFNIVYANNINVTTDSIQNNKNIPLQQAFQDGERLSYDIKYGIISAGEAVLNANILDAKKDNDSLIVDPFALHKRWHITSIARTNSFFDNIFKVRDKIESVSILDSMFSLRFEKNMREGKYRQHRIHQNYPDLNMSIYTRYSRSQKKYINQRMDIPDKTFDLLSAFYKVRTMDLTPGKTYKINITADGKNYVALVIVHRIETIETIFGDKTECLVLEPALQGESLFKQTGEIFIWLTNDNNKIPVLLQSKVIFGNFKAILNKAENINK
ncbi:MAG: DUF3108 domain-containing protein [Candidatus Cloacimonetes bacterium]|jgi:hypothetical protein|nr:DUF3108 domain-containing protein [Candidatus Cloacimonadota bacterium]MDD4155047.1 DUF3108 domain-containing protein [Candidatus Cloacimonadota bacterium]